MAEEVWQGSGGTHTCTGSVSTVSVSVASGSGEGRAWVAWVLFLFLLQAAVERAAGTRIMRYAGMHLGLVRVDMRVVRGAHARSMRCGRAQRCEAAH